jgi:hypothetical protein
MSKSTFTYKETTVFMLERKNFYWSTFDRRLKNRKYDISDIINVIENRKPMDKIDVFF